MFLASFENREKCSMSKRVGGNVREASNETGEIGWTNCVLGSLDFIMRAIGSHGRFWNRGFEIPPTGLGRGEYRG